MKQLLQPVQGAIFYIKSSPPTKRTSWWSRRDLRKRGNIRSQFWQRNNDFHSKKVTRSWQKISFRRSIFMLSVRSIFSRLKQWGQTKDKRKPSKSEAHRLPFFYRHRKNCGQHLRFVLSSPKRFFPLSVLFYKRQTFSRRHSVVDSFSWIA